jgi:hypothetical protein
MTDKNTPDEKTPESSPKKKPYTTPTFRFEPVFEVSALACGKIHSTESGCHFVHKAS